MMGIGGGGEYDLFFFSSCSQQWKRMVGFGVGCRYIYV